MAEKPNLSGEEAAKWLGVSLRTVYRLAQRGKLPSFKVGGQWRFSQELLREWVRDRVSIAYLRARNPKQRPSHRRREKT